MRGIFTLVLPGKMLWWQKLLLFPTNKRSVLELYPFEHLTFTVAGVVEKLPKEVTHKP